MNRRIGVILSYAMMIVEIFSAIFLTPVILSSLGQAEYGVYRLAGSITAYLFLLDLGMGNAVIRYIAKFRINNEKENTGKFLGLATIFYSAVAVIALIAGTVLVLIFPGVFSKGLTAEEISLGQKLLGITMINAAVTLGASAYDKVIVAYEKYAVSKISSIVQIIIRMTLTFVALKLGVRSVGIVSINLLMTVLGKGFSVLYVFLKIKLIPKFKEIPFGFVKEIVLYSSLILLQMIATQINTTVDQILIGSLVAGSSAILAVYSVGTQIVQYYQSLGSAFNGVLMPGIVGLVEKEWDPRKITDEMIRISRIIFMFLALIWGGFLICGKRFIDLWVGSANADAYLVALILMSAYLFALSEAVGSQILWALNEHKEQAVLKISIVVLNVILTVFLIQWNPLIGATIGTFISLVLGDVLLMNLIFAKKLKVNLLYYYRNLLKGIAPSLLVMIIVGYLFGKIFLPMGLIGLLTTIAIMCIAYMVMLFLIGMNAYEKQLILSVLRKINPFKRFLNKKR